MIEVSGIRVPLAGLDGTDDAERRAVRRATLRMLHLPSQDLTSLELRKRSIDARRGNDVHLLFTARVTLRGGANAERALLAKARSWRGRPRLKRLDQPEPHGWPHPAVGKPQQRPVVIGAGCAGLFCALALAEAGLEPLLVERGDGSRERAAAIERFNATGVLDPQSNIQFGLGGAGTFSDGKLATGTKSPSHRLILETFVAAGAPERILWDAKPHVGSDLLPAVVERILARIVETRGEVRLRTRLVDVDLRDGQVHGVTLLSRDEEGTEREEHLACSQLVLACGHSARDVYQLLAKRGVRLERKTFAMGVRIEHLQQSIDQAQYGRAAGHPALGAAPYKLAVHLPSGRGAFSFCMCPGGYVVAAASEEGGVVTNGMSLSDRAGTNANAGLLANVLPGDLPGSDVLAGVELQRRCERAAYAAGGGAYVAPAQLVGDFLRGQASSAGGAVVPTYPRGVRWGSIDGCLPGYVGETLRASLPLMAQRLRGFAADDAVLTGVETRSSSPVRVTRGDDGQSVNVRGIFPCGEGAGYAGGIMSAAADGIRCAEWLVQSLSE